MPQKNAGELKKAILLFAVVSGLLGAANSFGEANYANYFKEVYQVTAAQRGFIEFPRELPGVLSMFLISAFGMTSDVTIAFLAQILCCIGMAVMGLFSPSYGMMLFLVFFHSMGQHVFMTIKDAIGMSLAREGEGRPNPRTFPPLVELFSNTGSLCRIFWISVRRFPLWRPGDPSLCHLRPFGAGIGRPSLETARLCAPQQKEAGAPACHPPHLPALLSDYPCLWMSKTDSPCVCSLGGG